MYLRFCFTELNYLYYCFVFVSTVILFYVLAFNTLHSNLQQTVNHRCCYGGKFRLQSAIRNYIILCFNLTLSDFYLYPVAVDFFLNTLPLKKTLKMHPHLQNNLCLSSDIYIYIYIYI